MKPILAYAAALLALTTPVGARVGDPPAAANAADKPHLRTLIMRVLAEPRGAYKHTVLQALRSVPGVQYERAYYRDNRVTVRYDPAVASEKQIVRALEFVGYPVWVMSD